MSMLSFPFLYFPAIVVVTVLSVSFLRLAYMMFRPRIISHEEQQAARNVRTMDQQAVQNTRTTTVVFAGSFNPPHHGHISLLDHLSSKYGEVIVVIGMNPNKRYDVSPHFRATLVRKMVAEQFHSGVAGNHRATIRVEVVTGLIWRYAMSQNAKTMYRGIRTWKQDGPSEQHLLNQNTLWPLILGPLKWPLPTTFLEGAPKYRRISSTLIRNLCIEAEERGTEPDLEEFMPASITEFVKNAYTKT